MTPDLAATPRPVRPQLLAAFGPDYQSIESLFDFCFLPPGLLDELKALTQPEDWGNKGFVLLKYLAVHIRMGIEQGLYVWSKDQIVLRAGQLATTAGLPIYVGLARSVKPDENPWTLNWVGERPSSVEIIKPVDLGTWPVLNPRCEVVVACDLTSEQIRSKVSELARLPLVTQISALPAPWSGPFGADWPRGSSARGAATSFPSVSRAAMVHQSSWHPSRSRPIA